MLNSSVGTVLLRGGDRGGGRPGQKGAGGVREAGEEGAGSDRVGTGIKGYGKREV